MLKLGSIQGSRMSENNTWKVFSNWDHTFYFLVSSFVAIFNQIMYCLCAKTDRRWRHFKIGDTRLIFAEKIHDGVFRLQSPTVPITLPNLRQTYQKFGKRHLAPHQLSGILTFHKDFDPLFSNLHIFMCVVFL